MTGEIGQLSLCLAMALALVMAISGLSGARPGAAVARAVASSATIGFAVFVIVAFGALTYAFVESDFSLIGVASNSHTAKPLLYKITGVWGNHEGSMLLWILVLALYSLLIVFLRRGGERLISAALGVQGLLALAFLVFLLFTSNPFLRLDPPPFEGRGLNPLLQDPGLAFHPPMLYLGYVGMSATFSYAASFLITREGDGNWARAARPFMLIAWIALTLGITLGSWWAYYELGWGGFWFWDPVENASLMPWLAATALLHSSLATERSGAFRSWTLLLAIAAFSFSLLGTFLVRSGVITSVHAFANDPERGIFILGMLVAAIGGALALFAWRAPSLETGAAFEPVSRESALLLNNVLLTGALASVFIGTIYPLLLDAIGGEKISVGSPYFSLTFAPVFAGLLLIVPFGPQLAWYRADPRATLRALIPVAVFAVLTGFIVLLLSVPNSAIAALSFALAAWVIGASALDLWRKRQSGRPTFTTFAAVIAHAGLGVTLLGVTGTTLWRSEALDVVRVGGTMPVAGYSLRLDKLDAYAGPNFEAVRATVSVLRDGARIAVLTPEKRSFPTEGQATSETAIRTTGVSDLYLALGDQRGPDAWTIRAYVNPLAPFIWIGGAIMAFGGLMGLFARFGRRVVVSSVDAVPAE
ncbi:MAG: heme lyase CcmF/NrfE family subunit [Alphaproteobacteria bacterium]|nr:heme lyase CcmF/NrfE family subunit [Alphaproteobacteria bacterium]